MLSKPRRLPAPLGLLPLVTAVLVLVRCSSWSGQAVRAAPSLPQADWTLLVYMAADDDLEQAAIENVKEMAAIGSSERVHVIVQIDRAPAGRDGGGFARAPMLNIPDFSSTKRLRVDRGGLVELMDLGETCTCDPAPLADFVAWGLTTYPATKTALVLWDHGGATHGFGWDVTNENRALSIVDMRKGIAAGLSKAGKARLDLLGFDACLMSNLGVAYELRHLSDLFIGSEEVEPSIGWAYASVITAMQASASPRAVAQEVVQSFAAACRATNAADMATLAAFETDRLDGVVSALDDLGDRLREKTRVAADWYPVARARTAAEQYGAGGGEQTPFATVDAVDLAAGAARALRQPNEVGAAVDGATVAVFHGGRRPNAHGLSLTFPRQVKERLPEDDALALASRPGARWDAFLTAYLDRVSADRTSPKLLHLDVTASPSSFDVSAPLDEDDLAEAVAVVGTTDATGALTVLQLSALPVALTSHVASYGWNRRLPAIGYGHDPLPVTVFDEPAHTGPSGEVVHIASLGGVLYRDGVPGQGSEVIVFLRVAPGGSVSVIGVYRYQAGGPGSEVTVHEADRFAPTVMTVAADGRITRTPSTATLPFATPSKLILADQPATAGDYAIGFRVTDYAANRMWSTGRVTVR